MSKSGSKVKTDFVTVSKRESEISPLGNDRFKIVGQQHVGRLHQGKCQDFIQGGRPCAKSLGVRSSDSTLRSQYWHSCNIDSGTEAPQLLTAPILSLSGHAS